MNVHVAHSFGYRLALDWQYNPVYSFVLCFSLGLVVLTSSFHFFGFNVHVFFMYFIFSFFLSHIHFSANAIEITYIFFDLLPLDGIINFLTFFMTESNQLFEKHFSKCYRTNHILFSSFSIYICVKIYTCADWICELSSSIILQFCLKVFIQLIRISHIKQ